MVTRHFINVFLAGSTSLDRERTIVRNAFAKWNGDQLVKKENTIYQFTVLTYENFSGVINSETGNKDYNDFIRDSADLVVFILSGSIGIKTKEEFDIAYAGLKSSKTHPYIIVLSLKNSDDPIINEIKSSLEKDEKYYIEYGDVKELDSIIRIELAKFVGSIKKKKSKVRKEKIKMLFKKLFNLKKTITISLIIATIIGFWQFTRRDNDSLKIKEGWEELYGIIASINNNEFEWLEECDDCSSLDPEVNYILSVKHQLDSSIVILKNVVDKSQDVQSLSNKESIVKQTIMIEGVTRSLKNVYDKYSDHIQYLILLGIDKNHTDPYSRLKKANIPIDDVNRYFSDDNVLYKSIIDKLDMAMDTLLVVSADINYNSIAKELSGDLFYDFYLSMANYLKKIHSFESSRVSIILDAYTFNKQIK